jgi:hypothetical protein
MPLREMPSNHSCLRRLVKRPLNEIADACIRSGALPCGEVGRHAAEYHSARFAWSTARFAAIAATVSLPSGRRLHGDEGVCEGDRDIRKALGPSRCWWLSPPVTVRTRPCIAVVGSRTIGFEQRPGVEAAEQNQVKGRLRQ